MTEAIDLDALERSEKQITPANMSRVAELYGDGAVIPLRDLEALIAELRASREEVHRLYRMFDAGQRMEQNLAAENEGLRKLIATQREILAQGRTS